MQALTRVKSGGYQRYLGEAKRLMSTVPHIIPLNQMNNVDAMAPHVDCEKHEFRIAGITERTVKNTWLRINRCNIDSNSNIIITRGVRSSLSSLMRYSDRNGNASFTIPSNVYPVYQQIADNSGIKYKVTKPTLSRAGNRLDISQILSSVEFDWNSFVLLTDPLPIGGQELTEEDIDKLVRFTKTKGDPMIVIDAVYAPQFYQKYKPLLDTQRAFICYSLSKTHFSPWTFGVTLAPNWFKESLFEKPLLEDLEKAYFLMEMYPNMANEQYELFREAWKRIKSKLSKIPELEGWFPSERSYYSTIPFSYQELVDKYGVLGIPPYVYDSEDDDFTIISCLNEVKNLQRKFSRTMYHTTTLSNFSRGYDKYSGRFSKLPESTFPDKFHLLHAGELDIGLAKTEKLLDKTSLKGDEPIIIETSTTDSLYPTERTGLAHYVNDSGIKIEKLTSVDGREISTEDAYARSLKLSPDIAGWNSLAPRTVSILPVAQGCQAKCPFCFSHSSVSDDIDQKLLKTDRINKILDLAKERGATRAVITGGGEPTLIPYKKLGEMIRQCSSRFGKGVMITNGYSVGTLNSEQRKKALALMDEDGLTNLCISRHGVDAENNTKIMHLDTQSENVAQTYLENQESYINLKLRWVCVLQKGGVDSSDRIGAYLDWVKETGVSEICFKELYVSSSEESVYHDHRSNVWSRENQIPLSLLTEFLIANGGVHIDSLPWGSPVYSIDWKGHRMNIAAYTEPSVYWERTNGICRSWNLMANGECFVSLEDKDSILDED